MLGGFSTQLASGDLPSLQRIWQTCANPPRTKTFFRHNFYGPNAVLHWVILQIGWSCMDPGCFLYIVCVNFCCRYLKRCKPTTSRDIHNYQLTSNLQLSKEEKPSIEEITLMTRLSVIDWPYSSENHCGLAWLTPLTISFSILKLDNEAAKQTHFNRQTFGRLSFCQGPRYMSPSNITKRGWNNHRLKLNRSFNLSLEGHSLQTLLSCACLLLPTC